MKNMQETRSFWPRCMTLTRRGKTESYCVFFSTLPRDSFRRTSPKWPILCRVGPKTLTQRFWSYDRKRYINVIIIIIIIIITTPKILLCRLVCVLCNGRIKDVQRLNPAHRLSNCRLALQLAHKHLQLPLVTDLVTSQKNKKAFSQGRADHFSDIFSP